jgi:tRNA A-37 threonylcarbamoyl transferase component Bud32
MEPEEPSKQERTELSLGGSVGPWRIEGELGRGGMSTVYAVMHTEIGKRAALKVVHSHVLSAEFPAAKVLLEAQVVNRIEHSSIVDIFENGTLPDGRPYLVMERLHGCSLEQQISNGRLTADEVIGILLQMCAALTAAHSARIVHCDLKPENVFLVDNSEAPGWRVKLLDWGIARIVAPRARAGRAEMAVGTPRYISPEQVQGKEPSPASDIYSLGVMAYELFLEEQLFVGDSTVEILKLHLNAEPSPPEEIWPGIPQTLSELLLSMLSKKPAERPTAMAVATALMVVRDELRRRGAAMVPTELSGPVANSGAIVGTAAEVDSSGQGGGVPMAIHASCSSQHAKPAKFVRPASALGDLLARRVEVEHTIPRRDRPAKRKRRTRRFMSGGMIAAAAATLLAGVTALYGYRSSQGGAAEAASATAEISNLAAATAGSVKGDEGIGAAMGAERTIASPEPVSQVAILGDDAARPVRVKPSPRMAVSAARVSARPGAVQMKAAMKKPMAAAVSHPRRAPVRTATLDGTIDPY